ncbi:MAG: Multidrug export protein MepA [Firmicutes bacterium ADurb.Bin182]|nr:MAG: Multidrug export protein MepA [Firmicutes bacterium ADurb.Bin182]
MQEQTQIPENKMGVMPVKKLVFKMSLPIMLSMFIQSMYNIVDSIFVSRISENALTAVSLTFPFHILIIGVSVGTGVGVGSLISRRLGAKMQEEADLAASNGLFLAAVTSVVFFVLGFFSKPILGLFTNDAEILDLSTKYLTICLIFSFGIIFLISAEKILQATGNMIIPMISQITGAVINIVLDPIMIFGYFGLPKMGVSGAATATVIGQIVAMTLALFATLKRKQHVTIRLKGMKPNVKVIKEIYKVGVPSIIMQAMASITTFGLNKILMFFTPTAVSVLGVYFKLQSFVFMPIFGLSSGSLPIMGYNYGARNKKRLTDTLKTALLFAMAIMLIGTAVFQLLPDKLLLLFKASPFMMSIGVPALRIISACFVIAGFGITLSTFFQALGKGIYSLIMSVCRQMLAILPAAYALSSLFGLGAVWWAFPISEGVALIICAVLAIRIFKREISAM